MKTDEILERRANVVRARLLRAVDALDERRHHVTEVAVRTKNMAVPTLVAVAAIGVLFGASLYAFGAAIRRRRRVSFGDQLAETVRNLNLARRPSFARRAAEKVMLSLLSFAATELVRRSTKNLVDGRTVDGRIGARRIEIT